MVDRARRELRETSITHLLREDAPILNLSMPYAIGRPVRDKTLYEALQQSYEHPDLVTQQLGIIYVSPDSIKRFLAKRLATRGQRFRSQEVVEHILLETEAEFSDELGADMKVRSSVLVEGITFSMQRYTPPKNRKPGAPIKKRYELGLRISSATEAEVAINLKEERHECNRVLLGAEAQQYNEAMAIRIGRMSCVPSVAREIRDGLEPLQHLFPRTVELGPLSAISMQER